jgi:hypothetical protein
MIYIQIVENNIKSALSIAQVSDKPACAQILTVYQSQGRE